MRIELQKITQDQAHVLRKLLELYSYDFTEFIDCDINENGSYGYPLEKYGYWSDPSRHPFFIRVNGKLAGFVLIKTLKNNKNVDVYSIAEFFILKLYRRKGLGRKVAHKLFKLFPGAWEIDQVDQNFPSHIFWRAVIDEYTKGKFSERHERGRMIQEFTAK